MLKILVKWHIDLIEKFQNLTGFSSYQILWLSFFEGVIIGVIISYFYFV